MSERIPNQVSLPSEEPKIWRRRPGSLKALWTQLVHLHNGSGRVAKQNRGSLMHFHHPVQGQRFRSRGKAFTLQEEKRPFTVTNFPTKHDISPIWTESCCQFSMISCTVMTVSHFESMIDHWINATASLVTLVFYQVMISHFFFCTS